MTAIASSRTIGVVGAGTMGAGIAQVAAAAGHPVMLFDAYNGAAQHGCERIAKGLRDRVDRGRMTVDEAEALIARVRVADRLEALANAALIVEAVVEDLEVKRALFADLEAIVGPETILTSNTSSISVTAIARDLRHPGRLVGMHFFNPAPVMKLVEVVSGVATAPEAARAVFATAEAWGKIAVHAKSTPGFIVNRVARPYYAEALRLLEEGVASPATIDALLTEGCGFRMGPFALMDLIGHDVNYAVSRSVFDAFYQDPRFRPSLTQLELVNAGRFGRKSGRGFYEYGAGAERPAPATETSDAAPLPGLVLGEACDLGPILVVPSDGRRAETRAAGCGRPVIVHDLLPPEGGRLGFAASSDTSDAAVAGYVAAVAATGRSSTRLPDWPGLVVLRTVAMLANEGFEAVLQGVADVAGVDLAMRYGVNYPEGPITLAREHGLVRILATMDELQRLTGDPRYRASLGLRIAVDELTRGKTCHS